MPNIESLKERYDLELEKIISEIKQKKAKIALLQFPDGLKSWATQIVDFLRNKTNAEFLIWFGTCYGACDLPADLEHLKPKIDLIIQFGHSELLPNY